MENEVYRNETEHLRFEIQLLADFELLDRLQTAPFCSVSEIFVANIYAFHCAVKRPLVKKGSVNHDVFEGTCQCMQ